MKAKSDKIFDSDLAPAKASDVILEIIRQALQNNQMVINTDNNVSPFIMFNKGVAQDIDYFVDRYCANGGSTLPSGKAATPKRGSKGKNK